jgi:hypothetical protein
MPREFASGGVFSPSPVDHLCFMSPLAAANHHFGGLFDLSTAVQARALSP